MEESTWCGACQYGETKDNNELSLRDYVDSLSQDHEKQLHYPGYPYGQLDQDWSDSGGSRNLRFGAGRLDQRSGRNFELEMQSLRSFLLISIVTAKYHEEQL